MSEFASHHDQAAAQIGGKTNAPEVLGEPCYIRLVRAQLVDLGKIDYLAPSPEGDNEAMLLHMRDGSSQSVRYDAVIFNNSMNGSCCLQRTIRLSRVLYTSDATP